MVPDVGDVLSVLVSQTIAIARSHVADAGQAAIEEAGDADLFLRRVQKDERLALAMLAVCDAASRTAMREKRIVLGRAVGRAARDRAKIDESELVIAILRDLETVHFRVLAELQEATQRWDQGQGKISAAHAVLHHYPTPLRAALERHGLLDSASTYGGAVVITGVNDFGVSLLDDLRRVAEEDASWVAGPESGASPPGHSSP